MVSTVFRGDGRPNDPFGDPLDAILAEIAISLQLPPGLHAKAVARYKAVCEYIDRPGSPLEGRVCVDVGANIGNHSVFFQKYFPQVVSIEANPAVFEILELNTRRFANVRAVNVALGEEEGEGILTLADDTNEGTGFVSLAENSSNGLPVKIMPLDALTKDLEGGIDLVKIDVEGFEYQVLSGAKKTLENHRPVILFEYYVKQQCDKNVFSLLECCGYKNFYYIGTRFDNNSNKFIEKLIHFVFDTLFNSPFHLMPVMGRKRDYNMVIAVSDRFAE